MANATEQVDLVLGVDDDDSDAALRRLVARKLKVAHSDVPSLYLLRRSIDARRGRVHLCLSLQLGGQDPQLALGEPLPRTVRPAAPVIIVGDGPAGLFCAYELARREIACVVLDRGKPVQPRRHDLKGLNQHGRVDDDSNYCFGEGGAGTYSDGKLYTRATKRGDVRDILATLVLHGAPPEVLTDARPHIGSNKLPKVVTALRERLESCGVEFRFGARVTEIVVEAKGGKRRATGVRLADGVELAGRAVVLATGHSARDVWRMLHDVGAPLEAKPFALGVRLEHPQPLINEVQYGKAAGHPKLPNAYYRLAETVDDRGVFSFCMCPGGFVVPAATEAGGLVVNGMSLSRRDSPFANSGFVVSVEPGDAAARFGDDLFAGVRLQEAIEQAAWIAGGGGLRAPATRMSDFLEGRGSQSVPKTSYQPGLFATDLRPVLDASGYRVAHRIREALVAIGTRMPRFLTEEAVLIGVESRTSAPIRVVRDKDSRMSPSVDGLFPCGEGAGFAGGIVSAAIDGVGTARSVAQRLASHSKG
ncbi:MAG: NAD(P)/FAD-dependent oxidoreductase [Myxococcota bacterium]